MQLLRPHCRLGCICPLCGVAIEPMLAIESSGLSREFHTVLNVQHNRTTVVDRPSLIRQLGLHSEIHAHSPGADLNNVAACASAPHLPL